MSAIDLAISEFGQSIDIAGLRLDDNDLVCLQFESSGSLMLQRVEDSLLILLVRPFDRFREDLLERALELCHPRQEHAFQPRASLTADEQLVLSLCLASREVQLASLSQAVALLVRLFDGLEK